MRTDIHRPSAIKPEDYQYVAVVLSDSQEDMDFGTNAANRAIFMEHMARTGGHYSMHEHGGTCHICGASAASIAIFYHPESNRYIRTGLDCAQKLDMGDATEFRNWRKGLKGARELQAGKNKARAVIEELGLSLAWEAAASNHIIADMLGKLVRYGNLSDKQIEFLRKLVHQYEHREELAAQKAAERAKSQHVGEVGKRQVFECLIMATPSYETQWGYTYVNIMLVGDNKVIYKGRHLGQKGTTVRFTAMVDKHDEREGELQTIVSRPTKIETVTLEGA